ncbi:hypothetical protein GGR51DRAFT_537885 [Nemania sp. FL0031]|nr:hypothetical protein GGR51DRAFT_537885 [Nemania sp. FL0031]
MYPSIVKTGPDKTSSAWIHFVFALPFPIRARKRHDHHRYSTLTRPSRLGLAASPQLFFSLSLSPCLILLLVELSAVCRLLETYRIYLSFAHPIHMRTHITHLPKPISDLNLARSGDDLRRAETWESRCRGPGPRWTRLGSREKEEQEKKKN